MADDHRGIPQRLEKDQVFASTRTLCLNWVKDHLPNYFQALDDKLFQSSERGASNIEQSRFYQAREEIQANKTRIQDEFLRLFDVAGTHYFQGMNTTTDFSLDPMQRGDQDHEIYAEDMNLVDNRELEDKLAVAAMTRKACADYSEALYALNQRMAALRGGIKVTDHSNPFAPGVFAESLQHALASLTLDEVARLLIYKVFENSLMAGLGKLYDKLNAHLKDNNVLPNLSYSVKKTPEEILADLPEELKTQLSDYSLKHQLELINAIQLVQRQLGPVTRYRRPAGVAPITVDQLLANFRQLQIDSSAIVASNDSQQAFSQISPIDIRQRLEEQIRQTDDVDENVIEIVGLLFEYMLNDQQLPDSVKSLLSYLHTPFLKIALLDKDFFNQPQHPARQLLNSLVAAGERWVEPGSKRKNEVFEQIRKVVQRVLDDFNNDVRLFSQLAFEFNQYLRQHSRRIRMTEKRARQAALGENKVKSIRLKVENYIRKKIGETKVTPIVSTLLYEPWANFLAFNLLRFGAGSEQWRIAAQVVDDILWYFLPHNIEKDIHARKRIEELQASLPETLTSGFETVGYDRTQGARLIDIVSKRSDSALFASETTDIPDTQATDIEKIEDFPSTANAESADPLLGKLKNMTFDSWFEFQPDEGDEPIHAKLAWSNRKSLHFMFVNRMGQQVAIKTGEELAQELRSGKAKMLSAPGETPFFEKAMEGVLEQIKRRAASDGH